MSECIDSKKIVKRLKLIQGQIGGIIKMVEDGKPCEDLLIQIGAAKSGLNRTGKVILQGHLHHCIADAIKEGRGDEAINRLNSALEQFSRIV